VLSRREWLARAGSWGAGAALLPGGLPGAPVAMDWPQFRGPLRDCVSKETGLARKWSSGGPKVLWSVPVAQGYAGGAIVSGRLCHHDYDEAKGDWCVNCRNLADGKLLWQFRETREIRPNHAITRTVPAVDARFVFSLDPKATLHCLDVKTGKQIWRRSLVTDFKATIPSWYNSAR
jgi:outer membrane protein assembly factor BamB